MSDRLQSTLFSYYYGALAFPLGFVGIPIYIFAPDFYATEYGLSLGLLGSVLFFSRLIDAIQDPLFGYLSDRKPEWVWPLMMGSGIVLIAGFFSLFYASHSYPLIWFCIGTFLITSAYSFLVINLNGAGAKVGNEIASKQKLQLNAAREVMGMLGLLASLVLFSKALGSGNHQTLIIGLGALLGGLLLIGLFLFAYWFRNTGSSRLGHRVQSHGLIVSVKGLSRPFRKFYLIYFISILASSIPAVLVIFFIRDVLQLESFFPIFMLLYFLSGALSIPVWRMLAGRFGVMKVWCFSMALAIVAFISAWTLGSGDLWPYAIICITSGLAFGSDVVMPPSILALLVGAQKKQFAAVQLYSYLAFLGKIALALATLAVFVLLDVFGFIPAQENSTAAIQSVSFLYSIIPCGLKLVAVALLIQINRSGIWKDFLCEDSLQSPPSLHSQ